MLDKTRETPPQTMEQALAALGVVDLHRIPHSRNDITLYTGIKDGEPVFIKASKRTNGVDRIENEAAANQLLHAQLHVSGIEIPNAQHAKNGNYSFAIIDYINGDPMGTTSSFDMCQLTDANISSLVDFLVAARDIPAEKIPAYFDAIAKNTWNANFYRDRLVQNASDPLQQGTVTPNELAKLQQIWETHYGTLTFQHHDLAPFNLLTTEDGTLFLTDAEYARMGMLGYDPAYFVLQTYCLFGESKTAAALLTRTLEAWTSRYPEDLLKQRILAPFAYRIVASLNDIPAKSDETIRNRTLRMKTAILTGDVHNIIKLLNE